ncbi:MAG: HpcH/HpaI aldolase family protein [Propylenella sp.]
MFDLKNPTLRKRLADGPALGAFWFALGNIAVIEAALHAGAEAIVIDMQHGLFDRASLEAAVGIVPASVPCLVRVEDDTPTAIGRALDAGAEGIIVPLVETAEQATNAAAACRYPPKGRRSGGGVRPLRDFAGYLRAADQAIAVGVMIETRVGVDNAAAIAGADGVDFVFIGTGDLGLSLGTAPGSETHEKACRMILAACRKAGTPCGIFTFGGESAAERIAEGYAMAIVANDISAVGEYFAAAAASFREATQGVGRTATRRGKTKR